MNKCLHRETISGRDRCAHNSKRSPFYYPSHNESIVGSDFVSFDPLRRQAASRKRVESHPIPFPSNRSWYVLLVTVPPKLSPERGWDKQTGCQFFDALVRMARKRKTNRRTAVRVHTRTRLIAYATESFLLLARHLVLACRSFPLYYGRCRYLLLLLLMMMITMIVVSKYKRFQLWMLHTADVVVRPNRFFTTTTKWNNNVAVVLTCCSYLLFLLVVVVKQLVDQKKQAISTHRFDDYLTSTSFKYSWYLKRSRLIYYLWRIAGLQMRRWTNSL